MARVYLSVPYAQKDAAKAMDARWDPKRRKWYAPSEGSFTQYPELSQWLGGEAPRNAFDDPEPLVPPRAVSRRVTVSKLSQLTRCEQQMVFDSQRGRRRSEAMNAAARRGVAEHKRRERAVANGARPEASPCFIATATFGPEAFETWTLRRWRNRRLRASAPGRLVIRVYERVSPPIARWLERRPRAARGVAGALRLLIGVLRV